MRQITYPHDLFRDDVRRPQHGAIPFTERPAGRVGESAALKRCDVIVSAPDLELLHSRKAEAAQ